MQSIPALIIIDMQKDFFESKELAVQKTGLVTSINQLTDHFAKMNWPIIWVTQEFKEDLSDAFLAMKKFGRKITIEGTKGRSLLDELSVRDTDIHITKKRYSGFFQTDLDERLKSFDIKELYVCGINSHACVRTTVVDAYQKDYEVTVVSDGVASYDYEHHRVSMAYFERAGIAKLASTDSARVQTASPPEA